MPNINQNDKTTQLPRMVTFFVRENREYYNKLTFMYVYIILYEYLIST